MRTFIAVDFPPEMQNKVKQITNFFKTQTPAGVLKWVPSDKLHLTLKFIGDIPDPKIVQVKAIITSTLQGQKAFDIAIEGLGMYPEVRNPRVICLGIVGGAHLVEIHKALDRALEKADIKPDRREYAPHLTIARVRRGTDPVTARRIGDTLSQFKVDSLGNISIDKIVFYQSDLKPSGPIYTPLYSLPLSKEAKP